MTCRRGLIIRVPISKRNVRKRYDEQINKCENGIVVCFACRKDEVASDFYFSKSLLETSNDWHLDPRNQSNFLGIITLMSLISSKVTDIAKKSDSIQTPEYFGKIDFPFAISKY
jgi:hypothetical protein